MRPTSCGRKPEFSSAKIGGTAGTIFLRGLGGPRLGIVMNDSLEAAGANHGTDPATSYIQPDAHDHITVVKGPNSVLYGSSMGGLVIFNENPRKFDNPACRPPRRRFGQLRTARSDGRRHSGYASRQLQGYSISLEEITTRTGRASEFFSFFNANPDRLIATFTPTKNIRQNSARSRVMPRSPFQHFP